MRKIVNDRVFEPAPALHRFGPFSVVMPDGDRIQFLPERTVHANPRGKRVLVEDAADYGVAWARPECHAATGLLGQDRRRRTRALSQRDNHVLVWRESGRVFRAYERACGDAGR